MDPPNRRQMSSGVTNLMLACQRGRDADVKAILAQKPFIASNRDRYGKTAVHYCAENSSLSCAYQVLSVEKSLVNVQDGDGYSPLHLAIISGNKVMARFLLRMGADVNAVDNEKHTCVHWATVCADVESLEILIDAGAKVSTADIHGAHPIHYVAQMSGRYNPNRKAALAVLRLLLQHGAQVDCQDQEGRQPLLWAACSGSSDAILSIVSAGGTIDAKDNDGLSALHYAASRGHTDCVDALITLCGANIDETDNSGCSALYYSVAMGQADCTQLLLKYGSDADHRDLKGRTPAHCGAAKGHLEMLKILETHGANLWIRNLKGDLPLHEAVHFGRKDLVCWLLDQKNNAVNAPNIHGKTSLHIAATNNNIELCQVLIDRGASLNALMKTSKSVLMTPLDAALSRRYRRCAKYLQSQGALPANKLLEKCEMSRSLINLLESCARPSSSEGTASPIANSEGGESLPSPSHQSVHDRCEHFDSGVHVRLSQMDIWDLWESLTQSSQRLPSTLKEEESQREDNSNQLIINNIYVYKEEEKTRNSSEVQKTAGDTVNYKKRTERLPTVIEQNKESNLTSEQSGNLECQSKKENNIHRQKYDRNRFEKKAKTEMKRNRGDSDGFSKESGRFISASEMNGGSDNLIPNKLNQNIHNEKSSLYIKKQMNEEESAEYKTSSRILDEEKETSTDEELFSRGSHDQDYHRQKQRREQEHENFINVDINVEEYKEVRKRNREKSDQLNQDKIANMDNYHLRNKEREKYYKLKEESTGNLLERTGHSADENGVHSDISLDRRIHKKEKAENLKSINKNTKFNNISSSSESSETLPTIKHTNRPAEKKTSREKSFKTQEFNSSSELTLPDIHAEETVSRSRMGQKNITLVQTGNEIQGINIASDRNKRIEREDSLSSFASETISISLSDSSEDISTFGMLPKRQKSKRKKQLESHSSGREITSSSDSDRVGRTVLKMKKTRTLSDNSMFENQANTAEDNLKNKPFKSNKSRRKSVINRWKKATEKILHYIKSRKHISKEMKYSKNKNAQCQTDTNYERRIEMEPSIEEYSVQNTINFQQEKYLLSKNKSKTQEDLDKFQHPIEIDHSQNSFQQNTMIIETKDENIRNERMKTVQKSDTKFELSSPTSKSSLLSTNPLAKEGIDNNQNSLINMENSVDISDSSTIKKESLLPNKTDNLSIHENRISSAILISQETQPCEEKVFIEDTQTMQHELPLINSEYEISTKQDLQGKTSIASNNGTEKENLQNLEVSCADAKKKNFSSVDVGIQIDERFHSDFPAATDDLKKKIEWSTTELKEKIGNISSTVTHHIHTTRDELSKKIDNSSAKLEEETKKSVEKLRDLIFSMKADKKSLERKESEENDDGEKETNAINLNKVCIVSPVIENCDQENTLHKEMKVNLAAVQKTEKHFEKIYSEVAGEKNKGLKEMSNISLNEENSVLLTEHESLKKSKIYDSSGNKERIILEKSIDGTTPICESSNNNDDSVQSENNLEIKNNVFSKTKSIDYMEKEKLIKEKKVGENIEKYQDDNIDKETNDNEQTNEENIRVLNNEIYETIDSKSMDENEALESKKEIVSHISKETEKSSTSQNRSLEENFMSNNENSNPIITDEIIQDVVKVAISERMEKNSEERSDSQLESESERKEIVHNGHATTDLEKEINQNQTEIKLECELETKMVQIDTTNKEHNENDRGSGQHSDSMQIIDKDLLNDPRSLEERINQKSEERLNETKKAEEERTGSNLEKRSQDYVKDSERVEKLEEKEFQKSALRHSNNSFPPSQRDEILETKETDKDSGESTIEEESQKGIFNVLCPNPQQEQQNLDGKDEKNFDNNHKEKLEESKSRNSMEESRQTKSSANEMSEHLTIKESSDEGKENDDNSEKCEEITNSKLCQKTDDSHNSLASPSQDIKPEEEVKNNQDEKESETNTDVERAVFNEKTESNRTETKSPDKNTETNEDIIENENSEDKNESQKKTAVTENNSSEHVEQSSHIIQEDKNNHDRDTVSEDKSSNQEYQNTKLDTERQEIQKLAEEKIETTDKMLNVDSCQEEKHLKENLTKEKNIELSEESKNDMTEDLHLQRNFSQQDKDSKTDVSCSGLEIAIVNHNLSDVDEENKDARDDDNDDKDAKRESIVNEICLKSSETENSDESKKVIDSNLEDEQEKHDLDKKSGQESKNIQEILSSDTQKVNENKITIIKENNREEIKEITEEIDNHEEQILENINKREELTEKENIEESSEDVNEKEKEKLTEKENIEESSEDTNEKEKETKKENIEESAEDINEKEKEIEKKNIEENLEDMNEKKKETEKKNIEENLENMNEKEKETEKKNIEENLEDMNEKEKETEKKNIEENLEDMNEKEKETEKKNIEENLEDMNEKEKETEKKNIEENLENMNDKENEIKKEQNKECPEDMDEKEKEELTEKRNFEETSEKTNENGKLIEKETNGKCPEDMDEKEKLIEKGNNIEETSEKTNENEELIEKEKTEENSEDTNKTEKKELIDKVKGELSEKENIEKTSEDMNEKKMGELIETGNIAETSKKTNENGKLTEKEKNEENPDNIDEKEKEKLTEKKNIEETSEKKNKNEELTEKERTREYPEDMDEKEKEELTEKENIEELTEKERTEEYPEDMDEKKKEKLTEKGNNIEETSEKTNENEKLTKKEKIEENSQDTNKKEKKQLIDKVKEELTEKQNIGEVSETNNENGKLIEKEKNEENREYHKTDIERKKSVESKEFIEKEFEEITEKFLERDNKDKIKTEEAPDEIEKHKINYDNNNNLSFVSGDKPNDFSKINKEKDMDEKRKEKLTEKENNIEETSEKTNENEKLTEKEKIEENSQDTNKKEKKQLIDKVKREKSKLLKNDEVSSQEKLKEPKQNKIEILLPIQKNKKAKNDQTTFRDSFISEPIVADYKQSDNIIKEKVEKQTSKKSNRKKNNLETGIDSRTVKINEEEMLDETIMEPMTVQQLKEQLRWEKSTPDGATYSLKVKSDGHMVDNENTTKNNKIIKPKRGGAFSCRNQWWEKTAFSGNDGANRKESRGQKIKKSNQTMPGPTVTETEQKPDNTDPAETNGKKDPPEREKETTKKAEDTVKNGLSSEEPRSEKEKEPPEKTETKQTSRSLYVPSIIQPSAKIKEVQQDRTTLKKFRQCYAKHKSSLKNVLPQTGKKSISTGSGSESATATSPRRVSDKSRTKRNVSPSKIENPSSIERSYVIEDTEEEVLSYMTLEKQRKALGDRKFVRRCSREIKSRRGSPGQKSAASKTRNVAIQASGRTSTRHRVCFGDGQYPVIQCVSCKSNEQSTTQVERGKRICVCDDEEQKSLSYLKKEFSGKMSRNLNNHGRASRRLATIPESNAGDCIRSCARTRPILPSLPTPNIPSRYGRQDRRLGSIIDQIQSLTSPVSFLVTLEGSSSATRHRLSINITPTKSKSMDDIVDRSRRAASVPRMKKGISLPNFQTSRHSSQKTTSETRQKRELPRLGQQTTADKCKETKLKRSPGKKKSSRNTVSFSDDQKPATSYNKMEGDSQPVTFHLDHGRCRDTFKLPTEPLKDKRKWEVTFTIKKDFKNKETEK